MIRLQKGEYVIGIDLGTTNTCAAVITYQSQKPVIVAQRSGSYLLKSCVQFGKEIDVGNNVYRHLAMGTSGIIKNSKRILGRYFNDEIVQRCIEENQCGVEIREVDKKPVFYIDDHTFVAPSDVAALVVKRIMEVAKEDILDRYKEDMKCVKVAVTFPANFNNNQRTATLLAVEKAGIRRENLKMLNEPSAAAFHYCKINDINNQTILVYDLGGGTFDVSIIRVENGDYTVLKYAGDPFLGGADFDALFAKYIERKYRNKSDTPLINCDKEKVRHRFYLRLNAIAEETKTQLSITNSYNPDLSAFGVNSEEDDEDDEDGSMQITRAELEECIKSLIDRSIEIMEGCIADCGLTVDDIDRVVLIGGSSRLKIVEQRLEEVFGKAKLNGAVNPDEAVACGACQSLVEPLQLKDRIVYSLGQRLKGGRVQCLIPRQTQIRFTSETLATQPSEDYTTCVCAAIYQGNAERVRDIEPQSKCDLIEEYKITGYDNTEKTNVTFLTTYTIDEWGIINVTQKYKEKNHILMDTMFRWKEPVNFIPLPEEF